MSPEQQQQQRQQQIEEVFQTAVLMEDEQQREEFLDQACAGDETIRGEVEKLLTGGVGVVEPVKRSGEDRELDRMIGRKVGVYKIEREIGRGGMGAVYLARRADGVFEQKVAVKLIKRGMDTDLVVRRFRNERQILATLSHPNITRLLDGGTTRDGLPFFVMEYVAGEQLYAFCDKNKLTIAERLRIFRQICDAVEEAHRHKIIHRDLKPSNILVKADGTPKLLDFGIAKLLDPKIGATEMAEPTATHLRMMTPQYASPEQISGEAAAATPASDIYSLGVLLYELLTGHRPYRVKSRAPYEIARAVREEEPTRPSQILASEENFARSDSDANAGQRPTPEMIFSARNASLKILRQQLAGDLDKIVLKALRKNPAERYQSAADLSGDLTNFLENRPVKAEIFNSTESREADEKTAENSIAILPFKLLGSSSAAASGRDEDTGGAGDDYLRVGLADALISRLSGVRRLLVRPTSSILRFQDAADIFAAGRELRVAFVVEGTIRSAGERVRVSVRLLSVKNSSTVWSGNFDEPFTDVLEIEDLISARVAETLLPHLTSEEAERLHRRGTNSPAAYEAYLRGRHFANEFKEDSLPKAVEAYREAVRLDPHFALPHVGIADFYVLSTLIGVMPPRAGYPLAKEELRLALEADERLAEAYSLLAFIALLYDWDWPKAERFVARALELNPNYHLAHDVRAHILASQGIADEAAGEIRLAESLDPLAPRAKLMTSCVLYQTRHFNEGARKAFEALEMEVNSAISLLHYGNSLTHGVSVEKAVEVLRQSARLWENSAIPRYMLCFALVAGGQTEEAREVLNEILKIAGTQSVKPYFVAMAYAALGETDAAFEWFEKSIEERDDWMLWFGTDIKLDALRRDPRYFEILRKTNNPIISRQLPAAAAAASSSIVSPTSATTTGSREKSIAVLPLKMLGTAGADDEYLTVGLADAMITRLSSVRRLVVRPTSSVLKFENWDDPFESGRQLGADYILCGTIRRAGERIRISAQLLDVKSNASLWADKFNEKFTDVLDLEDIVAERVGSILIPKLTGEERRQLAKRGTDDPQAFEAYLRGRFHWNQFTPDALLKARAAFQTAIDLDPRYALAHVGLADFYIWATIYGLIPSGESLPRAEAAARRAIELDEHLGEAYASLGLTKLSRFSWQEAERLYQKALELAPNYVHAHEWWAAQLVGHGNFAEGAREIRIAERLDPLSLRTKTLVAWTLYQAHRFEEALEIARQIVDLDKNYPQGYAQLGNNLRQLGKTDEAVANYRKFNEMIPDSALAKCSLCHMLAAAGQTDEARQILNEMQTLASVAYVKPYFLGLAQAAVGERDAAFANFEKAVAENDPWMLWFGTEPLLDAVRDDERYLALMRRMNLPLLDHNTKGQS